MSCAEHVDGIKKQIGNERNFLEGKWMTICNR